MVVVAAAVAPASIEQPKRSSRQRARMQRTQRSKRLSRRDATTSCRRASRSDYVEKCAHVSGKWDANRRANTAEALTRAHKTANRIFPERGGDGAPEATFGGCSPVV